MARATANKSLLSGCSLASLGQEQDSRQVVADMARREDDMASFRIKKSCPRDELLGPEDAAADFIN